jgi:hypothetical protein
MNICQDLNFKLTQEKKSNYAKLVYRGQPYQPNSPQFLSPVSLLEADSRSIKLTYRGQTYDYTSRFYQVISDKLSPKKIKLTYRGQSYDYQTLAF